MIDLNKLSEILNRIPSFILSSDKKDKILEQSKILYEMNEYICQKYNITPSEAEGKLKEFLSEKAKVDANSAPSIKSVISWAVEFSKSEGFPKSDEFEKGLQDVINILGPLANLGKSI